MVLGLSLVAAVTLVTQGTDGRPSATPAAPARRASHAVTLATHPPAIDGRDDDAVWRDAQPITDFQEWRPSEGGAPKQPTEAKVAYDAGNLYVFVRAFDSHPDSIITLLTRRDNYPPTDMIWLFIDSYHDRRTGFEFGVNPLGVKMDMAIYNDGNEDPAWDAVWDAATRIDSAGWTAEFRIPLSQLRYGREKSHTFGLMIDRNIYRYSQRTSWPLLRQSVSGFVSQFGEVTGLDDLEAPRRLEAAPYVVTKNARESSGFDRSQDITGGADLKYRVASNLTLDATINPDFGQVEADPSVLNLTAFETFFYERRPFFVQGAGTFQFNVNCSAVNDCGTGEGLVYSRRVGRPPQLAGYNNDSTAPAFSRILGAGKLTGRLPGGMQVGVFDAVTQRMTGSGGVTVEPATNYNVVRLRQDLRKGESSVGGILTAVNRDNDSFTSPYLHSGAYVGAVDFRHRFPGGRYELSGSLDMSRVNGSAQAIRATQEGSTHYYQRPDVSLPYDSIATATSLSGDAEELQFGKVGGQHFMFQTGYQRRSPGFEINDLGYLQRADQVSWSTWAGYFDRRTTRLYQRFQWNFNWWQFWTTEGLPEERAFNTNWHITFRNTWSLHTGGTLGQLGETYCYSCARGGPAVRQDPYFAPWGGIVGDDRKAIVPVFFFNYFRSDGGRSKGLNLSPSVDFKFASRVTAGLSVNYSRNTGDAQPLGRDTAGGVTHYTFGHMEQRQYSITSRITYPFTANMTLQVYAQPFIAKGTFTNKRELSATPRAADYDARYQPYGVPGDSSGFNIKQFRSNVVFRWEYRPGSTLFVVWSQGRSGFAGAEGTRGFGGELGDLFKLTPDNTFLVKLSYWLNR